tara:strand:- start:1205 stop:1933 length:729 start_codon:yes stop_codon:yes gene_type:complete
MTKNNIFFILVTIYMTVTLALVASANDIYITQVGDTLDLDITQDGQNNEFGDSTTNVSLNGASMTFAITQTGNNNDIAAVINGANYTGTWTFTGSGNSVDLLCSSAAAGNCESVTLNITTVGDDNTFDFDIGETADADSSIISFTITGDDTIVNAAIDGESAAITVVSDNSTSLSTNSAGGNAGNVFTFDIDGDGSTSGHTVNLTVTGGGSTYDVTQSGIYDNTVSATFTGDNQDVDITQSD